MTAPAVRGRRGKLSRPAPGPCDKLSRPARGRRDNQGGPVTSSPLTAEAPAPRTEPVRGGRRRRLSRLTKRDITVLSVLLAIPVLLDLALIWATTIASI